MIKLSDSDGALPFQDYLKLQDLKGKQEMMTFAMQQVPNLLQAGADAARSLESKAASPSPQAQQPQRSCASCHEQLMVPDGHTTFTCPACHTSQTLGGVILNSAPAPGATQRTQPPVRPPQTTPAPSRLAPDISEEYIIRPENRLTSVPPGEEVQAPVAPGLPLDEGIAPANDYESMP